MAFSDLVGAMDRTAIAVLGDKVVVTYAPAVGAPVPVTGIFDKAFVLAKGSAEAGVEAGQPAVFLRLEDLPTDPEADEPLLTIKGVVYRVIERDPDDMGGIVLWLRKVT